MDMHVGQLLVPAATARALIDEQFPKWRGLRLHRVSAAGTVHEIFRLGDRLAARFRLEADEVESVWSDLRAESEAARELAGHTRFATPEPVAIGAPGRDYPMPWLVQTWLDGTVAMDDDPGESERFATDLAEFHQWCTPYRHARAPTRRPRARWTSR